MAADCTHLDAIELKPPDPAAVEGCEECLKAGDSWVHLRACLTCGKIGCCDSSPNQHASKHAEEVGHPLVHSAEPGEEWTWCFVDEVALFIEFD